MTLRRVVDERFGSVDVLVNNAAVLEFENEDVLWIPAERGRSRVGPHRHGRPLGAALTSGRCRHDCLACHAARRWPIGRILPRSARDRMVGTCLRVSPFSLCRQRSGPLESASPHCPYPPAHASARTRSCLRSAPAAWVKSTARATPGWAATSRSKRSPSIWRTTRTRAPASSARRTPSPPSTTRTSSRSSRPRRPTASGS